MSDTITTLMNDSFQHVAGLEDIGGGPSTYLAVGVFDGVHRGHQALLNEMAAAAHRDGARAAVLTFFPHPVKVIRNLSGRMYLCSLPTRVTLLGQQGLDVVVTQHFDEGVRHTRAADFVDQLKEKLNLTSLWGGSFGLGYNREGDLDFLRQQGREKDFSVHQFEGIVEWDGERVSSSRVRRALVDGRIQEVTGCLGRRYQIRGRVVPGDGRGRTIGIPTANLAVWDELLLPATGVYATFARVGQRRHVAATNIGYRPTVDGESLHVEAHLLDFEGDLYDRDLNLEIIARVRDERKFASLDALVQQIQADIIQVRRQATAAS